MVQFSRAQKCSMLLKTSPSGEGTARGVNSEIIIIPRGFYYGVSGGGILLASGGGGSLSAFVPPLLLCRMTLAPRVCIHPYRRNPPLYRTFCNPAGLLPIRRSNFSFPCPLCASHKQYTMCSPDCCRPEEAGGWSVYIYGTASMVCIGRMKRSTNGAIIPISKAGGVVRERVGSMRRIYVRHRRDSSSSLCSQDPMSNIPRWCLGLSGVTHIPHVSTSKHGDNFNFLYQEQLLVYRAFLRFESRVM